MFTRCFIRHVFASSLKRRDLCYFSILRFLFEDSKARAITAFLFGFSEVVTVNYSTKKRFITDKLYSALSVQNSYQPLVLRIIIRGSKHPKTVKALGKPVIKYSPSFLIYCIMNRDMFKNLNKKLHCCFFRFLPPTLTDTQLSRMCWTNQLSPDTSGFTQNLGMGISP